VEPSTVQPREISAALLYEPKGGEVVLKLFAFKQGFAVSTMDEEGQTMAEYGVMLSVITLAVLTAISLLSGGVVNAIESVTAILPG
jgi:Flp pilus assembly pilin Flp